MGLPHGHCPSCDINLSLTSSKFLNCLHAYCSHCLRKMENRLRYLSGQNNRSGSLNRRSCTGGGDLGNILCPKCHVMSSLSIRYGIDKLVPSNFVYQLKSPNQSRVSHERGDSHNKALLEQVKRIEGKLGLTQRLRADVSLRKSRFLSRANEARDYLDGFVAKANGAFDSKRLSLLKQIQKIRLRVTNYLVSKITLLEQLEVDLQYLLDLVRHLLDCIIKCEEGTNICVDQKRRSAAPVLYSKSLLEKDVLMEMPKEHRFSTSLKIEDELDIEELLSESILPLFNKRFEALSQSLSTAIHSMDEDQVTTESLRENPKIVYLPENYTLFEKVVCEIPILMVDGNNIPIVGSHHLQDMTCKFVFGSKESLPVELQVSGGLFKLRFIPPSSGKGQIIIKHHRLEANLMTTPTQFEIKPLLLDIKSKKNLKTIVI